MEEIEVASPIELTFYNEEEDALEDVESANPMELEKDWD
jgi:hypothetical protein